MSRPLPHPVVAPAFGHRFLAERLTRRLRSLRPRPTSVIVAVDPRAAKLALPGLRKAMAASGLPHVFLRPRAFGERAKTLESVEGLARRAIRAGADRRSLMIAVGGGATSDVVGFAAATLMRGVRWGVVPTTLLAMADASIGGKTGVNLPEGKNLVGAFHFPEFVISDLALLKSLPAREWRSGLGEVLKSAVLAGPRMLGRFERTSRHELLRPSEALEELVRGAARLKVRIVRDDPEEGGRRALLNLGHTFGHALERAAGPKRLTHGEAVGLGMLVAARVAATAGGSEAFVRRLEAALEHAGLPTAYPGELPHTRVLTRLLARDKKARGGGLTLVLPLGPGRVVLATGAAPVEAARAIREFLPATG